MNTDTLILKKIQEFALGGVVTFNISTISGDWNGRGALISAKTCSNMSLALEIKIFGDENEKF